MRRIWITMPLALMVLALLAGCGGNTAENASQTEDMQADSQTAMTETDGHEGHAHTQEAGGTEAETASVTMNGTLGCGHCSYHLTETCAPAMKAEDGVVYILESDKDRAELMDHRLDNPEIKVAGRVAEVDGQKVIYTDSVEMF